MKIKTRKSSILFILAALPALLLCRPPALAGVYTLAGTGTTIPAYTLTNFPQIVQVGTFNLATKTVYLSQNGVTNAGGITAYGRLTFDGTNFFTGPQSYTNSQVTGTNETWLVTNITFPVYAELQVTNSTPAAITNFQAQLQQ